MPIDLRGPSWGGGGENVDVVNGCMHVLAHTLGFVDFIEILDNQIIMDKTCQIQL